MSLFDDNDSWLAGIGVDVKKFVGGVQQKATAVVEQAKGAVSAAATATGVAPAAKPAAAPAAKPAAPKPAAPTGAPSTNGSSSFALKGSVGAGGNNNPDDVKVVQTALKIDPDGKCGTGTIAAIKAFQKSIGQANPDGRIDVGGATSKALAGRGGGAAAPAPAPAPDAPPAPDAAAPQPAQKEEGFFDGLKKKVVGKLEEAAGAVKDLPGKALKGAEDLAGDAKKALGDPLGGAGGASLLSKIGAPGSGGSLDDRFQAALAASRKSNDFKNTAELLNGFSVPDIEKRLAKLGPNDIKGIHQGAIANPRVGPNSNVAQLTASPDDIKGSKGGAQITAAANNVAVHARQNATAFQVQVLAAAEAFKQHAKPKIKELEGKVTAGDVAQGLTAALIGKIGGELAAKIANETGKKIVEFTTDKIKEKAGAAVNSKSSDIDALNNAVDEIVNAANAGGVRMQGVVNEKIIGPCDKILEAMKTKGSSEEKTRLTPDQEDFLGPFFEATATEVDTLLEKFGVPSAASAKAIHVKVFRGLVQSFEEKLIFSQFSAQSQAVSGRSRLEREAAARADNVAEEAAKAREKSLDTKPTN
jgi:hypothetical protein